METTETKKGWLTPRPDLRRVAKLCGADAELGNFVLGAGASEGGSGAVASRALLEKVEGVGSARRGSGSGYGYGAGGAGYDAQDWGRKYLPANGGCIYIDLNHLELCVPEVRSAWDHVAASHAMLRLARRAQRELDEELPEGASVQVLVNNSDGRSNSYGSHLNFLMTREAWDDLFSHKLHYLLFLASHQVSSIVLTGQGKVGAENRQRPTHYQISQRADFMETLTGEQTTYHRPIVNSRDEALCGGEGSGLARLHCIFYDNNLCHVAALLKVGTMQILLAMIEAGAVSLDLVLEDPVRAVTWWSHGADLHRRCPLLSGESLTAVELQLRFLAAARSCEGAGVLDTVPRVGEVLDLWEGTLELLLAEDWDALSGRLDWVLKYSILERSLARRGDLAWDSPELAYLDQLYSSLDPEEGLYWAHERSGVVERVVSEAQIERFVAEPPDDTRAWARAMLLRALDPAAIRKIDWDGITVRTWDEEGGRRLMKLCLDDPRASTRAQLQAVFRSCDSPQELMVGLGAKEVEAQSSASYRSVWSTPWHYGR